MESSSPQQHTSAEYSKNDLEDEGTCKPELLRTSTSMPVTEEESDSNFQYKSQCCRVCCQWVEQNILTHPLCPSWATVSRVLALAAFGVMLWGSAFTMLADTGPHGQLFAIGVLCVASHLAGWIVSFTSLPPLLGMLMMGILLRNIGFVVPCDKYLPVASTLRKIALVVILTRAGMGLDPAALKRLSWMVVRLSLLTAIIEAIVVAVTSHFFLGLPWLWGFLLGAVLAAVSPGVVIPCLFNLRDKGYGTKKGIPTLIVAAASFDDINAISAFGILQGIIFSEGNQMTQILQGPMVLVIGLLLGTAIGVFLRYIPQGKDTHVVTLRSLLLAAAGMLHMLGMDVLKLEGAGPLGCIVTAFVACHGWRSQGWSDEENPVADNFVVLWSIFQPILFGLIGTEINLSVLEGKTVGLGIATVLVSAIMRMLASTIVVAGGNLNIKEKLFVALAWCPKATAQAALGPVALDLAREKKLFPETLYASKVLMVAVLAILITAPIGAIFITLLGPRLLHRQITESQKPYIDENEKPDPVAMESLITEDTHDRSFQIEKEIT